MKTQLKKDEKVIIQTQPHWFTLVGPLFVPLIMLASILVIGPLGLAVGAIGIIYFIYKSVLFFFVELYPSPLVLLLFLLE